MVDEDGVTKVPLFTIEEDDIPEGVEGKPQEGRFTYKQFLADGFVRVPRSEGDNYGYTALKDFIDDPEANPRETPSGKLEIYCQGIADFCKAVGFTEKSPIAKYEVPEEGFEETFDDWEAKAKGEYPFQLVTLHCLRTVHSSFDNVPWCKGSCAQRLAAQCARRGRAGHCGRRHGACHQPLGAVPAQRGRDRAHHAGRGEARRGDVGRCGRGNGHRQGRIGELPGGRHQDGLRIQAWNSCNVRVEKWMANRLPLTASGRCE